MTLRQAASGRARNGFVAAFALALAIALIALVYEGGSTPVAAQGQKLEASIFSFDGKDFTRTKTTLMTAEGKSAAGTKLDQASPAYKALIAKQSYSGDVTVFGKKYDASYAPLTNKDGKVTGALFVGVLE